jgi:hypothetical protein
MMKLHFPKKKYLMFNSRTNKSDRTKCLSDPNKNMLADMLIYTPTITAGVSIETHHYNKMFCLFTD